MCGITGIAGAAAGGDRVGAMTRALIHRGPDGEGYHAAEGVALGQRRLSIIDIEGGRQPIANEDETLFLVCNGEIYNSPTLRAELIASGHRFRTATDVEVILHLYEEHGPACVRRLRGMFAFAVWDARRRSLFLARDHMGQKPLFYSVTAEGLIFASEVKAILASGLVRPEPDLNGIWHYISLRYPPDDFTMFRGVHKLAAATSLLWCDGKATLERYWQPEFTTKLKRSEADIVDELDELLNETVALHTLADVEVGAFLSGGIDSSTVAAMLAKRSTTPLSAFSIGVEEQSFNELPYARMVAEAYGMKAHEEVVRADLIRLMPQMVYYMDEPSDPFGVGVFLASRLASRHVKVTLSGDGGDENFAGYDRYAGQRIIDLYCLLPRVFRATVMKRLVAAIPESFGYKSIAQKANWLNELSLYDSGERYAQSMSFLRFRDEQKQALFTDSARDSLDDPDSIGQVLKIFCADNASELVDRMLYTDLMTRMPDHLLAIGDRMSMAHSLESRPVLVDYRLVEFAASIPAHLKLKHGELKYMLRRVAERYLPRELITRKKQGFSFPIGVWMRTELRQFLLNLVERSRFVQHGLFRKDYVSKLVAEHLSGRTDHNYRLWILINLEFWYRSFIEGENLDRQQELVDELMESTPPVSQAMSA